MALLIQHGEVITATDRYRADIYCEDETITRIEPDIPRASLPGEVEVIDAAGQYVFPGFIDPHVHIHLPFMGTLAKDDYESASQAALVGGTTTLIEMICPGPADEPLEAFETWNAKAAPLAAVDYTFHMSVVRFDPSAQAQFREIVTQKGIPSFKVFLAYKGALNLSDEDLFGTLSLAKELGVIVTAHCENAEVIDAMQRTLEGSGKTGPEWHYYSRPPVVEAEGVHHLATFAELTGAHIYTVHTSCDASVRSALEARYRGVDVWIEAVVPHLVLDKTYAELPDFEGAKYVMSPPLREKHNQAVLWNGLRQRIISTVGTDHAPFDFAGQKEMGREAFTKIPNGVPSIQERANLVHTYGVEQGRIDLQTMVDALSTQAAKLFGMYPKKGTIAIGSDADLVIFDPAHRGAFALETSLSKVDYCAYEGWEQKGRPTTVTVRGEVQVRDGSFVGRLGSGRLIEREPTHF
ncbi:MAG: dihydropyrimidinase [Gemmatimonadales bacterium]|nr:dihydropyrimidinase [Gemmatimonadales bacterium]